MLVAMFCMMIGLILLAILSIFFIKDIQSLKDSYNELVIKELKNDYFNQKETR